MKKRGLLAGLVLLLFQSIIYAQTYSIQGTVQDQQNKVPLSNATVQLHNVRDSSNSRTLTDSAGRFVFPNLAPDSFVLSISFVGYNPVTRGIRIDTSNVNVAIAATPNSSNQLATVIITATVAPVTQKQDTIQMSASQYKVNPDASGEDLVRKMPGITIENGQVKANGENVQKVTIDGRDLFGDDATAALRNLPAEVIDKIQVYDRMSDQAQFTGFDDGNTTKAINIVTKTNVRNGQFGRVFAGYGTDGRYLAGGNATIFSGNQRISIVGLANNVNQQNFSSQDLLGVTTNGMQGGGGPRGGGGGPRGGSGNRGPSGGGGNQGGGNYGGFGNNANFLVGQQAGINNTNSIGINYSNIFSPKLTVSASYFFNDVSNTTNETSGIKYFSNKLPNRMDTTNQTSTNINHRFNMRLEYKIDSFNQLIEIPSLAFQTNQRNQSVATSTFYNPNRLVNVTDNTVNSNISGNNLNNTLLFRHAFHKRGRTFSININTSYNQRYGDIYANGQTELFDSTGMFSMDSILRRYTNQNNHGFQVSTNLVYTEPVGKKSILQFNYNPTFSKSMADQESYRYDNTDEKYSLFDTSLSNKFNSRFNAQNAGFAYRRGDRNNNFSIGAGYQHSTLMSDQTFPQALSLSKSFDNILPNAFARLKLSEHSNLRFLYRTNINQPSVTQLQDVYDVTNLPFITAGNPDLKPQYNHLISTRYTYTNPSKGTLFVGNFLVQAANNYIANGTFIPLSDSVINSKLTISPGQQLTKPVNLNGYLNLRSFLTFAVPVKLIRSNINFNGGVSYSKLPGILNNVFNTSKTLTYSFGTVIGSNISQYVDFTLSYSGNYNTVQNQIDPSLNTSYFQQVAGLQLYLLSKNGWFFQNDLTNQLYTGLSQGFNQVYTIWNMSAGRKFLSKQRGELKISVFDLLNQNRSITRNITETYIQDVSDVVLRQYFMLTFTYNLRNFGKPPAHSQRQERRNWNGGF